MDFRGFLFIFNRETMGISVVKYFSWLTTANKGIKVMNPFVINSMFYINFIGVA